VPGIPEPTLGTTRSVIPIPVRRSSWVPAAAMMARVRRFHRPLARPRTRPTRGMDRTVTQIRAHSHRLRVPAVPRMDPVPWRRQRIAPMTPALTKGMIRPVTLTPVHSLPPREPAAPPTTPAVPRLRLIVSTQQGPTRVMTPSATPTRVRRSDWARVVPSPVVR